MKTLIERIVFSLTAVVLASASLAGLMVQPAAAAAGATLSLSPASGSVQNGNQLSLKIYEDSGSDQINAVQANLSFPTGSLSYVTTNYDTDTFEFGPSPTVGSGSVQIARATSTPKTGSQLVATVVFKAVAGSGSASVTFASGSAVVMADGNGTPEPLTKDNGTYTLTSPPPPPPPQNTGGGSGGSSGGSTQPPSGGSSSKPSGGGGTSHTSSSGSSSSSSHPSSPSSTSSSTPSSSSSSPSGGLSTSNVQVSHISGDTATVSWQTSVPASSEVDFGLDTNYGFSVVNNDLTTNHSLALNSSYLKPNETYHYIVKSIDSQGNVITSADQSFKTAAAKTTAPKKNDFWIALAIVIAIGVIVIAAAETIRRLRQHHQRPGNYPPAGPGGGPSGGSVDPLASPVAPVAPGPTDTVIKPSSPAAPPSANQPPANNSISITDEGELKQG